MGQMRANGTVKLRPGTTPVIFPIPHQLGSKAAVVPAKVLARSKNPFVDKSEVTYYFNAGAPGTVTDVATTILKDKRTIVFEVEPLVEDKAVQTEGSPEDQAAQPKAGSSQSGSQKVDKATDP